LFYTSSPGDQLESSQDLEDQSNQSAVNDDFNGSARSSDGNIVGIILSSIGQFFTLISFTVTLPGQLFELGLPYWAAQPLGALTTIMASIGFIQFASGRRAS
jgi:hypothetical protein